MRQSVTMFIICFIALSCTQNKADQESEPKEKVTKTDTTEVDSSTKKSKKKLRDYEITEDGTYKKYYPNGNIRIKGKLNEKKQKTGMWRSYRKNGEVWSKNEFKNDKRHGLTVAFHKNGTIKYRGHYKRGKKSGTWIFYDKDGERINKKVFDDQ